MIGYASSLKAPPRLVRPRFRCQRLPLGPPAFVFQGGLTRLPLGPPAFQELFTGGLYIEGVWIR